MGVGGGVGRRDSGSGGCFKMADVAAGLKPEGAAYWSRDRILYSGEGAAAGRGAGRRLTEGSLAGLSSVEAVAWQR